MTTKRRRACIGAITATVLLVGATACASESDDSSDSSPAGTVAESTVESTDTPATDAPTESTTPSDGSTSEPAASNGDDPAPTNPPVAVPQALQFSAPLVGGGTFDGAAAAGKPTVFWFWAPT